MVFDIDERNKEQLVNQNEQETNTYRMEWVLIPTVILTGLAWYFIGNPLAGLLIGLGVGIDLRGVGKKVSVRGDAYAKELKYVRPLALRLFALAFILIGAYCSLTKTTYLVNNTDTHNSYHILLALAVSVLAIMWTGLGNWKALNSTVKNWNENRRPKTDDEKALQRFDENVFRKVGLNSFTDVSKEEILPRILEKSLDDKERGVVKVAVIPGKQTVKDYTRKNEEFASAWGVPRVKIEAGEPLKDGSHTVEITCLLKDTLVKDTVLWKPTYENLDDIAKIPVAQYVKELLMGAFCESGDEWLMNLDQRNFMISGQPKYGKSSFTNALVAHLILHPDTRVHFMDLKNGAEAETWGEGINGITHNGLGGAGVEGCLKFVKAAVADMKARYGRMVELGISNAWTENNPETGRPFLGPEEPIKLLIVDECSRLFRTDTPENTRLTRQCIAELQEYIEQGRAAGYILVLITQFPRFDNLPTELREIASDSIAFRLKERGMSAALGSDFTPESDWNDPRKSKQGEGIVVNEEFYGEKIKMAFLTPETKREVISKSKVKGKAWLDDPDAPNKVKISIIKPEEPENEEPKAVYPVLPQPKKAQKWNV